MKLRFSVLWVALLVSVAASAEDCRVILQDGYDDEAAKILSTRGFELVDERKLEDPGSVGFRIYDEFERRRSTGEIHQVMRFNRDLETLVSREYPGSREWQGKFMAFLAELPMCREIDPHR